MRAADRHAYVVYATHASALRELDGLLYWDAPKGRTLETRFGKRLGARMREGAVTTRNLNTLERILATG